MQQRTGAIQYAYGQLAFMNQDTIKSPLDQTVLPARIVSRAKADKLAKDAHPNDLTRLSTPPLYNSESLLALIR